MNHMSDESTEEIRLSDVTRYDDMLSCFLSDISLDARNVVDQIPLWAFQGETVFSKKCPSASFTFDGK